jgi:mono/diheme cytochrome c family protein
MAGVMLGLVVLGASRGAGQVTGPQRAPLVIPSMFGQDLFGFYCATCHGLDAKGNGPVASALKTHPPDITLLARRNRGTFPRDRVIAFIANGGTMLSGAHGSSQMPIWGPIFVALDPSDTRATIRIENVVQYVESIQSK